ncbi:MAG: hypothetical protein ABIA75_10190 [Candidatus Neomarinimicrobiota bacterium]
MKIRNLLIISLLLYPVLAQDTTSVTIPENQSGLTEQDSQELVHQDKDEITSRSQTDEIKFFGDYIIEDGVTNYDKVRIVGGDLTVFGTIEGQFTVIGGDIFIKQTAVVNGRIVAIGGTVTTAPGARVNGRIIETNISRGLSYKDTHDGKTDVKGESNFSLEERSWYSKKSWVHPKTSVVIYNRNEGLLLTPFNYCWDRRSLSNLRLNLSAGYRFSQKEVAGRVTLESYLLARHLILFGSAFQESRTDDFYRLPEMENSLAAVLGRQDFYDRWNELGYEGGFGLDLPWIRLKASYVAVDQDSISIDKNVWTVFNDNRELRPNLPVLPGKVESMRLTFAFKPHSFDEFEPGLALYLTGEQTLKSDAYPEFQRIMGMAILGVRVADGVVLRTRLTGGTATGTLPAFRYFGVGGLGSVAAYPYKLQAGDQFAQVNAEFVFTPDFLDSDMSLILFADGANAWMRSEYDLTDINSMIENGISAVGLGIGFDEFRINFARPTDGSDYWESTIRINFNF